MKGKDEQMNFATKSPELQAYFEQYYENLRERIAWFRENPALLEEATKDRPHVLKRFEETAAMSREELMQEIEADYYLFVGCCVWAEQRPLGSQAYFDEYCGQMRIVISVFRKNPMLLEHRESHVLKRFKETAAMSREELMQEIKADYFLFHGTEPIGGAPRY
jgi:hypothetical protein